MPVLHSLKSGKLCLTASSLRSTATYFPTAKIGGTFAAWVRVYRQRQQSGIRIRYIRFVLTRPFRAARLLNIDGRGAMLLADGRRHLLVVVIHCSNFHGPQIAGCWLFVRWVATPMRWTSAEDKSQERGMAWHYCAHNSKAL